MYEYGTLNPVKVILRNDRGKRENNGWDEPKWGICTYENVTSKPPAQILYTNKNNKILKTLK
jgi:hypothetical protein